jgi:hypothetical protein
LKYNIKYQKSRTHIQRESDALIDFPSQAARSITAERVIHKKGEHKRAVHFLRTTKGGFSTHRPLSLFHAQRFLGLKRHRICHCRDLVKKYLFL